ncbi:MAG: VOC family protein [Candidatus Paceibacterota bacterium]
MKTTLNPYIMFDDATADAMKFYQSVFGGDLEMQTYGEAGMAQSSPQKDRIIHASLTSDVIAIMASDIDPKHSPTLMVGNNVALSIVGSDKELLTEYFLKLSMGGTVEMRLEKQFWGDLFGSLEDKFGIHWMVNISEE